MLRAALKPSLNISINDLENTLNSDRAKTADCIKLFRVIKIKVKCEEMQRTV